MRHRKANLIVSVVTSLSLAVAPITVAAQSAPELSHAQAQASLGTLFWYIDEMRARVDDAHFDPDAMAYALNDDPVAIFDFVQREIAYQPYAGLLRFGSGTLMNLAGNSCDQAALLGEMLLAGGHEVRFVTAPMTPQVQALLLETAHVPATALTAPDALSLPSARDRDDLFWLGYADDVIDQHVAQSVLQTYAFASELVYAYDYALARLGPLIEETLGAEAAPPSATQTTHCWVQLNEQGKWRDMDVAAWWLPRGARA